MILKDEIVLRAGVMNRNNRIYSQDVVNKINEHLQEKVNSGCFFGEPANEGCSEFGASVRLNNVSHIVTKLYVEGADLKADIRIMDTPNGKVLRDVLTNTPKCFVFRPRSFGTVGPAGNVLDCTVVAFDAILAINDSFLGII